MRHKHVLAVLFMIAACQRRPVEDAARPTTIEPPPAAKRAPNPRELASIDIGGVAEVTSLVVRDKKVYWVEHVPVGYETEGPKSLRGSVRFASVTPEPRPSNDGPPTGKSIAFFAGWAELAIDGKHAFLAVRDDDKNTKTASGSILRVALRGGKTDKLVPLADAPRSPVIDGDVLWYHDAEGVAKVALTTGKPAHIAKTKGSKILVDDSFVWVLEADRVAKVAKSDGAVTALGTTFIEDAGFAIDASFVYGATWIGDAGKSYASIVKVPKTGGAPVTLVSDQTYPRELTLDDSHVYWINGLVKREAELRRVAKDGRGAEVMVSHEVLSKIASTEGAVICASAERAENGERVGPGVMLSIAK